MVQKARRGRRERKARGHLSHLRREEIEGTQFSSHFFFSHSNSVCFVQYLEFGRQERKV